MPASVQEGVFDYLRLKNWTLAVINQDLQAGTSVQAEPNCTIVAILLATVRDLAVPWIVVGDFNVPIEELQATSLPTEAHALLLSPEGPTTDHGACLDFAMVSQEVAGCFTPNIVWDAPFRPHALVSFTLCVDSAVRVPQLPQYRSIKAAVHSFKPSLPQCHIVCESCQELSEVTSAFACWSRDAAASCGVHDNFPGGSFELLVKPLAAPTTPHRLWKGQAESFWDRVVAWTCHRNALGKRLVLDTKGWLDQAHNHWAEAEDLTYQKWHDQALLIFQGSKPDPCWLSATLYQQKQARKAHLAAKASDYQSWLTSSMSAGMRPLFRSLSSPEAKVERPFLDSSLDFRPFLRLEFWAKLWKAQPSPLPPLESQLHQRARSHAASLSPLTLHQLKARLRKLSNKAGGADGWSYAQRKVLPDEALEALLKLFRRIECDGVLPGHWRTTLITMLPKNLQVERPIALCNAPYRLWAKLRYTEVELWVKNFTVKAPWEHAVPGQSTLEVSIRRLLQAEEHVHSTNQFLTKPLPSSHSCMISHRFALTLP